ncbi:MAG: N-glycosylase/DNA lyase [Chloroflexia bacterium]|jgi:N-glycosylase/DNA lyase|nr:N-glycosylase/DNA lyase [Chloroflexia bacterium]
MAEEEALQPSMLEYPAGQLHLEYTLSNGQMFRWRKTEDGWWDAVIGSRMLRIRQVRSDTPGVDRFEYFTFPDRGDEAFLRAFLRLDVELLPLYESWTEADPYLGSLGERFLGLRIVLQRPEECLLSFMCSTANFIPRIMKAIAIIARDHGEPIKDQNGKVWTHAFPAAETIANLDPIALAEKTGLEWRAGNLVKVARQVASRPAGWLDELARLDYATARGELMRLEGVGPKIADCVCLFAMSKDQAVPVDTHVWQLTRDRYLPALRGKSLTPTAYGQVLQFFQSRFQKAGWAQQYLFYDHLLESRAKRGNRS